MVLVAVSVIAIVLHIIFVHKKTKEITGAYGNAYMETSGELEVGDILMYLPDFENPFKDHTWDYELVRDVKKNSEGETYFISSKCNFNGELSEKTPDWEQNTDGYKYTKLLYKIANHIILE